jgi:hypothetical protein
VKHVLVNEKAGERLFNARIRGNESVLVNELRIAEDSKGGDDIQGNECKGCERLALTRY